MGPRCSNCNKFVSLELDEPEFESEPAVDESGCVSATVRLTRSCGECGEVLREATFDLEDADHESDVTDHQGNDHSLEAEVEDDLEAFEEDNGRFKKRYFGVIVSVRVRCSCQDDGDMPLYTVELTDKVAASGMEDVT